MKKFWAVPLFLAISMSLIVSITGITPSSAEEPKMADTYEPYFEPVTTRGQAVLPIQSNKPLPQNTRLEIVGLESLNCFGHNDVYIDNGVELWTWGTTIEAQVAWPARLECSVDRYQYNGWSSEYWRGWEDVTFKATPSVLIRYPDGSIDTTSISIDLKNEYSLYFNPKYNVEIGSEIQDITIQPGQKKSIEIDPNPDPYHPAALHDFPQGTTFALRNEKVLVKPIIDNGGSVSIDPNTGEITIEVPTDYAGDYAFGRTALEVEIAYPEVAGHSAKDYTALVVNIIRPTAEPKSPTPKRDSPQSSFSLSSTV